MLAIDIAAERLATPLPHIVVQRTGYVAVVPDHAPPRSTLMEFVDWPVQEGRQAIADRI
jgi:hypothetical protein